MVVSWFMVLMIIDNFLFLQVFFVVEYLKKNFGDKFFIDELKCVIENQVRFFCDWVFYNKMVIYKIGGIVDSVC